MATCTTTTTAVPDGSRTNPFLLRKGQNFGVTVTVKQSNGQAFDLTNYTGRAHMRKDASEASAVAPIATFTVTNRTPATLGKADVTLAATLSPNLAARDYVADVEFENNGDATDVVGSQIFYVRVVETVTKL